MSASPLPASPPTELGHAAPELRHFATVTALVGPPVELGKASSGMKRIIPITGGTIVCRALDGSRVTGTLLPGGADFQTLRSATVTDVQAKYAARLDSADSSDGLGDCIEIDNRGVRTASAEDIAALVAGHEVDPDRIYFRCIPTLDGTGDWQWLSERVFLGTGVRLPDRVEIDIFEVL